MTTSGNNSQSVGDNEPSRPPSPTDSQIRRWRRNLAEERAEHAVYRAVAAKKTGEERDILLKLADAERRHESHWIELLGDHIGAPVRPSLRTRLLGFLARHFGSVFSLALMQYSEERASSDSSDRTSAMVADETVHVEVVRALAARGRASMSGTFRAAVFGANDGLVSNLALVLGVGAAGVAPSTILLTGISGLLAGALSMAAGEWVSVRSQRELLEASTSPESSNQVLPSLDVNANELELVYRARGMSPEEAEERAELVLAQVSDGTPPGSHGARPNDYEEVGSPWRAAFSSFGFFAAGALVPVIPYIVGMSGLWAVAVSALLVGVALLFTGGVVGVLSGKPPLIRAFRQLAIGYGAAAVTYALGLIFGNVVT